VEDTPASASPPRRAPRERRWTPLLLLLGIGGATLLLAAGPFRGECGFLAMTGAPCPGCGMTRAALALARGDAGAAWRWHPAVFAIAAIALGAIGLAAHEALTGRRSFRATAERHGIAASIAVAALLAALWIVRVVWMPEWSPDPLRPGSVAERLLR
jgi:hypothetical protein